MLNMAIGVTLFVIVAVVILIYILVEFKRLRHKVFAMLLIALIVFSYVSVAIIFREQDVDLKTIPGVMSAARLYFSWLGSVFVNMKDITANVVKMDWGTNKTVHDFDDPLLDIGS